MTSRQIIPAVVGYCKTLAETVVAVKGAGADATVYTQLLTEVSDKLSDMKEALVKLQEAEEKAAALKNGKDKAFFYKDVVRAAMDELRVPVDKAELLVDKKVWPMPTYGDLIFEV